MAIEIIGTGRSVPAQRVTNNDLASRIDTSDEWIRSHTGIGSRYVADEQTAASDLGIRAALAAMNMAIERGMVAEKTPEELALSLDLIVLGTSSPDYYGFPATACIVQNALGAKNAGVMDVLVACSGFIYCLETAAALLNADPRRKRALVVGAEVLSRLINWDDRATCVLFGDGSGAVLLEKTENTGSGVLRSILGADGSGWEHLLIPRGGGRAPWKHGETVNIQDITINMNGQAVYNFAVGIITETLGKMFAEENVDIDDIAMIIPHQANARIIQAAAKRLKIPAEKVYTNMEEYANTSTASIPICLDELNRAGKLKKGDLIITVGFGAGLTYGGNLIRW